MLTDFKNYFTVKLSGKFATKVHVIFPTTHGNMSLHYLVKNTIAKIAKF